MRSAHAVRNGPMRNRVRRRPNRIFGSLVTRRDDRDTQNESTTTGDFRRNHRRSRDHRLACKSDVDVGRGHVIDPVARSNDGLPPAFDRCLLERRCDPVSRWCVAGPNRRRMGDRCIRLCRSREQYARPKHSGLADLGRRNRPPQSSRSTGHQFS